MQPLHLWCCDHRHALPHSGFFHFLFLFTASLSIYRTYLSVQQTLSLASKDYWNHKINAVLKQGLYLVANSFIFLMFWRGCRRREGREGKKGETSLHSVLGLGDQLSRPLIPNTHTHTEALSWYCKEGSWPWQSPLASLHLIPHGAFAFWLLQPALITSVLNRSIITCFITLALYQRESAGGQPQPLGVWSWGRTHGVGLDKSQKPDDLWPCDSTCTEG